MISNDQKLENLIIRRNIKKERIKTYYIVFNEIHDLTGLKPSELIAEARKEQKPDWDKKIFLEMEDRKINKYFNQYYNYLKTKNNNKGTIKLKISALRSFYNEYNIELPKPFLIKQKQRRTRKTEIPSWQDVKKAVDNTENLKYKALILFLATTGLRVSDVVNLTIKDLLKATKQYHNGTIENLLEQDPNNIIPVWDFDPQKTKDEGNLCITFNTPETTEYLFNYLKNRISKGYNTNNDSPLFNSTQTTKKYNSKSVTTIFKQVINPLVGNRLDTQNRAFFRPHNLRKLFKTTCSNNIGRVSIEVEEELPFTKQYDIVSILAGHKPHNSQITEIYEAIDSEDIKPYYFHLIPYLSINKVKIKDIKSDEYIKLENKLKDKDTQLDNLTARFNDFEKERNKIMTQIKKLKENER